MGRAFPLPLTFASIHSAVWWDTALARSCSQTGRAGASSGLLFPGQAENSVGKREWGHRWAVGRSGYPVAPSLLRNGKNAQRHETAFDAAPQPSKNCICFLWPPQAEPSSVSGCVVESTLACYKLTLNVITSTRRASCEFKQTNKAN